MEERIASLEAHVGHIQEDMRGVKSDLRKLLWAGIIATFVLLTVLGGAIGVSYVNLDHSIDRIADHLISTSAEK